MNKSVTCSCIFVCGYFNSLKQKEKVQPHAVPHPRVCCMVANKIIIGTKEHSTR